MDNKNTDDTKHRWNLQNNSLPFIRYNWNLPPDDTKHRWNLQRNILAGLIPSQTGTMFVDGRLYRFYNTLSAFSKGLSLKN
jgi:hypothetical protein